MTMLDGKCEVCFVNPPIGVACTIMPYSCAYCAECARRFAQPLLVCEALLLDVDGDLSKLDGTLVDDLECFFQGRYMSFREWAALRVEEEGSNA